MRMISSILLSLALLAFPANAQLSNIPTKLMRARVVGAGGLGVNNRATLDRRRRPASSSSHRRRMQNGGKGGGLRQLMSMDTTAPSATPAMTTTSSPTAAATPSDAVTTTAPQPTSTTASTSNDGSSISSNPPTPSTSTLSTTSKSTTSSATSKSQHGPIQTKGLTVSLVGMTSIPNQAQWESTTSSYYMNVYNDDGELSSDITNVKVQISITNVTIVPSTSDGTQRRKRRRLSNNNIGDTNDGGSGDDATKHTNDDMSVEVTYTQIMWYNTAKKDDSSSNTTTNVDTLLLKYPLSTDAYRDEYVGQLKHTLDGYEDLTAVSGISIPIQAAYAESGGGLTMGIVIAMAAGGAALLTVLGIIVYVHCKECRSKDNDMESDDDEEYDDNTNSNRQFRHSTTTGGQTLDGVSTVDYDYQRSGAYGAGADCAAGGLSGVSYISDALGTIGSRLSRHTGAAGHHDGIALVDQTIFSDDPTYTQSRYNDGDDDVMVREEMLDIYAPSGKLGVVIDNPDGIPTIHAVKDTSPIATQVYTGDRVVAVDDEDVRGMSAMKVSRLISRKSGNVSRKLTIIRSVRC
jgi:hypothetical protein